MKRLLGNIAATFLVFVLATGTATRAQAQAPSLTVLHSFTNSSGDGGNPRSAMPISLRQKQHMLADYSRLPLSFEPNQGQASSAVKYLARGARYSLLLTGKEAVLVLRQQPSSESRDPHGGRPLPDNAGAAVLRLGFQNANPATAITGEDELPGKSNYFIGNDPRKWRTGVPNYARVRYHQVYPGIDVLYYGNQSRLEYDFVVAPGVPPQQIGLSIQGAEKLDIDHPTGDLVMQLADGTVRLRKPLVYQETKTARQEIAADYVVRKGQVTFRLGDYDHHLPLIIDPVLSFSTYLGGSGNELFINGFFAAGIALDANNNVYVTGETVSPDFPTTPGAYDTGCGTDVPPTCNGGLGDVFITQFSSTGVMLASTFLGGSDEDIPGEAGPSGALAVDATGLYVAGLTFSLDFPTLNALHSSTCPGIPPGNFCSDGFVTKLQPGLNALIFSTYVTGNGTALDAGSLAVDSMQNIYVTGSAGTGFPATPGAFQQTCPGTSCDRAFVMKLNSAGGGPLYSTLIGGSGYDDVVSIALDSVTPPDAYLLGTTTSADFPTNTTLQPTPPAGGVAVSTNGGINWATHLTGLTTLRFFSVAFNPAMPATVLAGSTNGISLSSDGGSTWTLKLSTTAQVSAIAFGVNPSNVYAGTRGQGVFVSVDGGNSWSPAPTNPRPNIFALVIDPLGNIYVGTGIAGVFKSVNGGQTWTAQNSGITDLRIRSLAIDPTTPTTIYAGTATSLFQSLDGGNTWSPRNSGLVSPDGSTVQVNALAITPGSTSILYAGTSAGIFKTTNGGGLWVPVNSGMSAPDGTLLNVSTVVIDPLRPSNVYAGTTGRGMYASTNGAASWVAMNNGLTLQVSALAIVSTAAAPQPVLYAATRVTTGFIAKLDPNGASLLASTFWGGNGNSNPAAIAADFSGAYVAGGTNSTNFFTKSPLPGGSTLKGASNAVISKLNTSLSSYSYSTYLGGSGRDVAYGLAVDGSGNAWVTGSTTSQDFPLANAVWLRGPSHSANDTEAFVAQLNGAGSGLLFSTYLGGKFATSGSPDSEGIGITVDGNGNAYVMGFTNTIDFPTANAFQPTLSGALGGGYDAFVAKIGGSTTVTDLEITLTNPLPLPPVAAGTDFVINLQVTNKSTTTAATGVVFGMGGIGGRNSISGIACTVTIGVCSPDSTPNGGLASLGTLAPGASAQISVTLVGSQPGTFVLTAAVRENETDANPADNSVSTTITILLPMPSITSLSPSSALADGAAFTLTVNGTNFVSSSTVSFNGNARATTFVSATQLMAAILASDIATAGTFNVTVSNPGGITSNAISFTVVTPQDATGAIINSVSVLFSQGVINGGQHNSLVVQLQHAISMMNAGNNAGAIGNLDSFISEVNDLLSSGVLTPSQAASLISAAQSVIAALP